MISEQVFTLLGFRSINGDDAPDVPQMSGSETLLVQKFIQRRQDEAARQQQANTGFDNDDDEQDAGFEEEDNEDSMAAQNLRAVAMPAFGSPPIGILQATIQPGGLRTLTPMLHRQKFPAPNSASTSKLAQKRTYDDDDARLKITIRAGSSNRTLQAFINRIMLASG